jgi:hypothetical protein
MTVFRSKFRWYASRGSIPLCFTFSYPLLVSDDILPVLTASNGGCKTKDGEFSASKERDESTYVDNTEITQEKETLSAGATAGIVITVLFLLGLAAYLIHQRLKQDDQGSSVSSDEEAGRLECSSFRDNDSDVSTSKGFGETNDSRPIEPPASPIRSVANSDDYIGVIVDE